MRHAVCALFVLAGAVTIPIRGLHQLVEAAGVAFTEQVTGLLPAEDVARRHPPWRTVIGLITGEEIQEQAGVDKSPLLAFAAAEDIAKQFFGLATTEKVLLVR